MVEGLTLADKALGLLQLRIREMPIAEPFWHVVASGSVERHKKCA